MGCLYRVPLDYPLATHGPRMGNIWATPSTTTYGQYMGYPMGYLYRLYIGYSWAARELPP